MGLFDSEFEREFGNAFGAEFSTDGLPPLGEDDGQRGDAWQGDDAWRPSSRLTDHLANRWFEDVMRGVRRLRRLGLGLGGGGGPRYLPSGLCHTSGCARPTAPGELFCPPCSTDRLFVAIWEGADALRALPTRELTEHDFAAIPPLPPMTPLPEPQTPDTAPVDAALPAPLPEWVGWVTPDCQWCRHVLREFGQRPPVLTAEQFAARLAADPTFPQGVCWRHTRPARPERAG
jgi:hypothetical protein